MNGFEQLLAHQPCCEQEAADQAVVRRLIAREGETLLTRDNPVAHLTASALVFTPGLDQVLLVHHNLYRSWGWVGGHADGQADLLAVAMREAMEETGLTSVTPLCGDLLSLDLLPVSAHRKRGRYLPPHLHISAAYALLADTGQPLRIKVGENSGVRWVETDRMAALCSEPHMRPVYEKIRSAALRAAGR
ncbi:MAG: NUDIX hydrolase [Clostridiales bacterium]|nr:NUDIX hydrolase [Clostridiales bacterium]